MKVAELVASALTGELVSAGESAGSGVEHAELQEVRELLTAAGWDRDRLVEQRRQRQAAGEPWPFPVPIEELRQVGFARFDALLAAVRTDLGLDGLRPAAPARRPLSADEQRLSAERPPHW